MLQAHVAADGPAARVLLHHNRGAAQLLVLAVRRRAPPGGLQLHKAVHHVGAQLARHASAVQLLSRDGRLAQLGELGPLQEHATHRLHLHELADGELEHLLGDVASEDGLHLGGGGMLQAHVAADGPATRVPLHCHCCPLFQDKLLSQLSSPPVALNCSHGHNLHCQPFSHDASPHRRLELDHVCFGCAVLLVLDCCAAFGLQHNSTGLSHLRFCYQSCLFAGALKLPSRRSHSNRRLDADA